MNLNQQKKSLMGKLICTLGKEKANLLRLVTIQC